jgi:hypothetical protein
MGSNYYHGHKGPLPPVGLSTMSTRMWFGERLQQQQGWSHQDARSLYSAGNGPASRAQQMQGNFRPLSFNQAGKTWNSCGSQSFNAPAPANVRPLPPTRAHVCPWPERPATGIGSGYTNYANPVWNLNLDLAHNSMEKQEDWTSKDTCYPTSLHSPPPPGFERTHISEVDRPQVPVQTVPTHSKPPQTPILESQEATAEEEKVTGSGKYGTYYSNASSFTIPSVRIPHTPPTEADRQPWINAMEQTAKNLSDNWEARPHISIELEL